MYTEHYGFTGRPFQLTPDPAFYYESRTHRKAMAYLGYGLAQGEGFIVVTGDIGAGKTILVAHLMATIDRARLSVAKLVSTQVEGDDMLRLAAQGLGVPGEGAKAQVLDRVERFLHEQARAGKRTLLIVDEAQNLATSALEELRMLSNFQAGGRALLQIFLLGQPEFREALKRPELEQLRQRVIATHHLDPMSADEVLPYVEHRLACVGWTGEPRFTPQACEALHAATAGVPRAINTLASRVLLHGALEGLSVIDAEAVDAVISDLSADDALNGEEAASEIVAPEPEPARPRLAFEFVDRAPPRLAAVPDPIADRLAAAEARLEEQEVALRRVLTLLIDWVERDDAPAKVFRAGAA